MYERQADFAQFDGFDLHKGNAPACDLLSHYALRRAFCQQDKKETAHQLKKVRAARFVNYLDEVVKDCLMVDSIVYSVEAFVSPRRAARMVCHERLAHLTRAGNSRTPAKIVNRPKLFVVFSVSSWPVTMR